MYVRRHEQFEIGCGAILNKIYYHCSITFLACEEQRTMHGLRMKKSVKSLMTEKCSLKNSHETTTQRKRK